MTIIQTYLSYPNIINERPFNSIFLMCDIYMYLAITLRRWVPLSTLIKCNPYFFVQETLRYHHIIHDIHILQDKR